MNTVYGSFLDYFHSIMTGDYDPAPVEKGIAEYLESIGIDRDEHRPDAEKIANRELLRFRLMPEKTFVAFFENYSLRERIVRLLRETESMAVRRARDQVTIDQAEYSENLARFYAVSREIVQDKRYTVWIEDALQEVTENLKYAAGFTERIPDKAAERILFADQAERQEE